MNNNQNENITAPAPASAEAAHLPAEAEQLTAASASPDWQGARQLCVLAVKYSEPAPELPARHPVRKRPEAAAAKPAASGGDAEQLVLNLSPVSKGIMERTTPVMWNNEDLDEPTFKRRNVVIDDGRRSSGGTR